MGRSRGREFLQEPMFGPVVSSGRPHQEGLFPTVSVIEEVHKFIERRRATGVWLTEEEKELLERRRVTRAARMCSRRFPH